MTGEWFVTYVEQTLMPTLLLPSGIVRGTLSVIGNGVVLAPWHCNRAMS